MLTGLGRLDFPGYAGGGGATLNIDLTENKVTVLLWIDSFERQAVSNMCIRRYLPVVDVANKIHFVYATLTYSKIIHGQLWCGRHSNESKNYKTSN